MKVNWPSPGKYIVAVSGGVDSVALLHLLHESADYELVVAHLDHGIRDDSAEDRKLVEELSRNLSLPFFFEEANLGAETSEAKAREVRYKFLNKVKDENQAQAIITAHHQDDLLETAIINILRGTGRKGLSALASNKEVVRPLLEVSKKELVEYAQENKLKWREDSTNSDPSYLRNYVRLNILPKFNEKARHDLLQQIETAKLNNAELDTLLAKYVDKDLDRNWFNTLSHEVAREVMASWLRFNEIRGFDSRTIERLVVAAKTAQPGKTFPVLSGYNMKVNKSNLALTN